MRRSTVAPLLLLLLVACPEPPPEPEVLCDRAVERAAPLVDEGLLSSGVACIEASADADAGMGFAAVSIVQVRATLGGSRFVEDRRLTVPVARGDDGWELGEPQPAGEATSVELKPGDPLGEADPAALAGEVDVPAATGAWTVPWVWFALPVQPGGEVDRAWALALEERARAERPDQPEQSLDERIAAAAVGVVADIDRLERLGGTAFGSSVGPRWSADTSWLMWDAPGLAAVTVTDDGLWLGSEPLAGLTRGRLHEDDLRGQLVGPLLDRLGQLEREVRRAEELSRQDLFAGRLLVVVARSVPADTLHRIAFTADRARFGELYLLVRDDEPTPAHRAVASLRGSGGSLVLEQSPGQVMVGRRGVPPRATDDPAGAVRGSGPAGVIATSRGVDVAAVAGLLDAAHSGDPGCVAWHAPIPEPPATGPAPALPAPRSLPPPPDVVSVLPWVPPLIGAGPCSTESRAAGGVGLGADGPTILGTLDEEAIRPVVDSHRSALRTCQRSGLARGLGRADVTVKFVVGSSGSVTSARIRSSTLGDERVEECIRERFARMQFPPPPGGGITIVHWPLELGR